MATIEKLIKAFEALKVFQPAVSAVEEVVVNVKKKDQPLNKNEKIANCNLVADCICANNMRSVSDFPKFLGIAMETFLTLCDDPEADIRMVADECLNRSIKTLLETNLGRLQVELYKEIKKNGSPRCLRAALWRFADMAHLIRPQKCRPYIVNLLPCLGKICKREDEGIQETLMLTMQKISPALMVFANDTEIKVLLKAFLPNLSSTLASCRRTAATSLNLICQHSRSPQTFVSFLLTNLLDLVLPVDVDHPVPLLLGVIQCIKNIIPVFSQTGNQEEGMKGSFGETKKNKETSLSKEQFLKVYQLLLYHTGHPDHNVVTVTLEALLQVLRTPPPGLRDVLTTGDSITETYIYQKDIGGLLPGRNSLSEVPSSSALSTTSEDTVGLYDESEISEIKPAPDDTPLDTVADMSSNAGPLDEGGGVRDAEGTEKSPDSENDEGVMFVANTAYSGVEIGDIQEDPSQKSNLSNVPSGSQDTLLSIKSLSPGHVPQPGPSVGQDLNGNPEIIIDNGNDDPVPTLTDLCLEDVENNLGSVTEGMPLVYCVRLICRRFLLSRTKGELMPDRQVRVSVKTLALGCVSSSLTHLPRIFLEKLFTSEIEGLENPPDIRDVLLYASHPDPQLRGHTTVIIGNFISTVLVEGRGDFGRWIDQKSNENQGSISIEHLIEVLLSISEDSSSVAARLAVGALKLCLPPLLHSLHSDVGLRALLRLLRVKNDSYWLVKVELLELIQCLDFKVIQHLETVCETVKRGSHHYLGELHLQDRFTMDVVLSFLGDEDARVRQSAATTLVKIVRILYYPPDHLQQDAVIALASSYTDHFLSPIMHEWSQPPAPLVQGLVRPYHVTEKGVCQHDIESALSRVVMSVLMKLQLSKLKHLTSGCCLALCQLSEEYLTSIYPHAWGCGTPTPLVAKETTTKSRRPPTRSLSSSSTLSLEELTSGSGGLLPIILSLLTSSQVTLDLSSHQSALQLAGNLIAGSVYQCLRCPDHDHSKTEPATAEETVTWSALSNRSLVPLIDQLLTHVARVLNVFSHVIDELVPGPPQIKTSLPSLPQAPSLSPMKRKAKGEKDSSSNPGTPNQDGKSAAKSQKDKDKELEKERNRKEGLGTFYTLPHYVKLYDTLKGAYSNYKISLDLTSSDKFCTMLKITLHVLSQILEVATLPDIGKHADEFLSYLRTTVSLEPTDSVLCVQQLLKALFGTNLCSQWEEQYTSAFPWKQSKTSKSSDAGLYQCTFSQPYAVFTQTLATATIKAVTPDHEDTSGVLTWLRKCVERKIPAILKPSSKADKTAIAAYIRLFEPLVIKALKQYTVTSSLELQEQVLDLLSQLVQLRVNYCLLDSDQVFIGFVIRQFEYIEEGQIRNSEILIPHIFNFLVMLSYEKFHSKTIISMPKIIQLCDGIMASGQHPTTHAIPALQPIVHDLFLLRGANKSDISKELETQREVLVSMLLRLINYYQALEMFVLVLQQCHRESEERWKRLSRQVTDILLPALAKQQINLNSQIALDVVHRLFESVAPIVFRPVDILLKTLLMSPADITSGTALERWLCLVLSILRVLMAQTKEEVVLSRIQELGIKLHIFKVTENDIPEAYRSKIAGLSPEYIMAWFLINIVGKTVSMINTLSLQSKSCDFLCQQLSHLLMYITHMFQSGLFRRIATASMKIIHQDLMGCCYDIKEINENFLSLGMSQPTLTLQYCNVLILLNFNDQGFWSEVIGTPKRKVMSSSMGGNSVETSQHEETATTRWHCCNLEIMRRGGLILFCDYACENLNDSEHMTWVLINHVQDLIELAHENPVQEFISAIHRNSSASSLLVQAIHTRWEDVKRPSVIYRTLKCLEAIHPSQSGALLILLIDKFLNTHHLSVARLCDTIACRRLELLLADSVEESSQQLPLDDLDKLLTFMDTNKLNAKHLRLSSLLHKYREKISGTTTETAELSSEPQLTPLEGLALQVDKACYLNIVQEQCFCGCPNVRECAYLLQYLEYSDMLMVMMTKEFNLSVLEECISLGAYKTIQRHSREAETPLSDSAHVDWMFDPLFQASQLTLIRHINNIINQLPVPHQILCLNKSVTENNQYMEKIEDLFTDHSCVEQIYRLTAALVQYLTGLARFPWKPAVPKECQNDICRFCTLYMECVSWSVYHNSLPMSGQLCTSLQCVSLVLQNHQLSTVIGQRDHVTWVCSITHSVHQLVSSLLLLPDEHLCVHPHQRELPLSTASDPRSLELSRLTLACDEVSELVQYLHTIETTDYTSGLSKLPACMSGLVTNIILGLSRVPVLNSYARTPPIVWKIGWDPTPVGEPATKLPPLPIDLMHDKEVLKEFIFRINSIGWISRQQFEETWMSLLGVLVPVTPEHPLPVEEDIERTHCMVLTVRAITGMLTQTILVPSPGNPVRGTFDVQPRDKPLGFLHTRCGKKLSVIRGIVEQEVQNMMLHRVEHVEHNEGVKYKFDQNLERDSAVDDYSLGQICVESIWSVVGVLDTNLSESDTTDSLESPPPQPQDGTLLQNLGSNPPPEQEGVVREQTSNLGDLDVHSCLQFLLELYRQWLLPGANGKPALMLLNEVIKSVVSLSDLFAEREQYDWMLDTLFEVYKAHPGEDEIAMQYLNVGVCKAAAVVGVDSTTADKLVKIIANGLKSTHLPSKISTLYGCLYLLEAAIPEVNKVLVQPLTEFLLKGLNSVSNQSISSQKYVLTMWATAFFIIENCTTDLKDGDFTSQILQLAVSTASSSEDSISSVVYVTILKGLERLLLTDVLTPQDAEVIVKLSVDRLCLPSPQRALAGLGLLFTCMYSGKQYDQYSPRPRDQEAFNMAEPATLFQDPESLIVAMERVTVLFDRIKKGYPYEARVIARVLPAFLADFFPPQDIMNKVIGEFLSSQQPYPQLIAKVVFQVFSNLHDQRQQGLLKDWVMLSLSNFTQRSPVSMAMWSLTCFFISASTNTWLRNLFSYVLSRMGKIDPVDKRLFCLAAMDFYLQVTDTGKRRAFTSTFQNVASAVPESPYKYLLDCIAKHSGGGAGS